MLQRSEDPTDPVTSYARVHESAVNSYSLADLKALKSSATAKKLRLGGLAKKGSINIQINQCVDSPPASTAIQKLLPELEPAR